MRSRPIGQAPEARKKRILILGAGPFQVASIHRAVELGYRVITLDYQPESIGHRLSHDSVECSTAEPERVLEEARRLEIDGVFSMASDVAVPAVAHVAQALGLPGPSPGTARALTAKDRFRELQRRAGLDHPRWCAGESLEGARTGLDELPFRVVVKPADTSGSRGVEVVDRRDPGALHQAFDAAAAFSRSGRVLIEEHVEGTDVSADGLVLDGRVVFVRITRKYNRGFVVTGHRLPGPCSPAEERLATTALEDHVRAAGYDEGPFDADLRIGGGRAAVLEMAPRLGGNGVPLVIARHSGVDLVEHALRQAMGEAVRLAEPSAEPEGCGSLLLAAPRSGRLRAVAAEAEVRRDNPGVSSLVIAACPGTPVQAHRHGGDVLGYAVFGCQSQQDYVRQAERIYRSLDLRIDPHA